MGACTLSDLTLAPLPCKIYMQDIFTANGNVNAIRMRTGPPSGPTGEPGEVSYYMNFDFTSA